MNVPAKPYDFGSFGPNVEAGCIRHLDRLPLQTIADIVLKGRPPHLRKATSLHPTVCKTHYILTTTTH